jgi:hypothetical protein
MQLKVALRDMLAVAQWPQYLHWILLVFRRAPKEESAFWFCKYGVWSSPASSGRGHLWCRASGRTVGGADMGKGEGNAGHLATDFCKGGSHKLALAMVEASNLYMRRGGTIPHMTLLYLVPYKV